MKTIEKLAILAAILISTVSLALQFAPKQVELPKAGSLFTERNAYSTASAYATTTVGLNAAVKILPRATSTRNFAEICNTSDVGRLHVYNQATSTGVTSAQGTILYGTTTTNGDNCMRFDANNPYTGEVWGIGSIATGTVRVETNQN